MTGNEDSVAIVTNQPDVNGANQRLVKSAERVRELGEVFTPSHIVRDMLDLLPEEMWRPDPPATFLEPACGDGNFLIAILARKLDRIADHTPDRRTRTILALAALSSIYGVDISPENIRGGPDHPIGARDRLLQHLNQWHTHTLGNTLSARSRFLAAAKWITQHNIQIGDMLHKQGHDTPIVGYDWDVDRGRVAVTWLTVGIIQAHANAEKQTDVLFDDTFGNPLPQPAHETDWDGLHRLPRHPAQPIDLRDGSHG